MKIAFFSTKKYDEFFFQEENKSFNHELVFFEETLNSSSASLAKGFDGVCAFVNDDLQQDTLRALSQSNIKNIALRCSGFNNVDLKTASELHINIVYVPSYSPSAVAEHAIALILALNRKIHHAYNRVRAGNFSLEGLLGFDMYKKTVGIIGGGKIGLAMIHILKGFGCKVLLHDPIENIEMKKEGIEYVSLDLLLKNSHIISLHCPLNKLTHHLICQQSIDIMRPNVMIINTGRGALINTTDIIEGLKKGKIGYLGLDVYEEEANLFFEDHSSSIILDDHFARLVTMPNVLITSHQGFFTKEALKIIAYTTCKNLKELEEKKTCANNLMYCTIPR